MTRFATTREAYDAYLRGAATLDEVSLAANDTIKAHLQRTGRDWIETQMSRPSPEAGRSQQ
jgi:hypothetical protein